MDCESNTEFGNEANTWTESCPVAFRGRHLGQRQRRRWPALPKQRRVGVARQPMNAALLIDRLDQTSLIAGEIGALALESLVELLYPLSRISGRRRSQGCVCLRELAFQQMCLQLAPSIIIGAGRRQLPTRRRPIASQAALRSQCCSRCSRASLAFEPILSRRQLGGLFLSQLRRLPRWWIWVLERDPARRGRKGPAGYHRSRFNLQIQQKSQSNTA